MILTNGCTVYAAFSWPFGVLGSSSVPIWNRVNSLARRVPKIVLLEIKKQEIGGEHDTCPKGHIARLPAARE